MMSNGPSHRETVLDCQKLHQWVVPLPHFLAKHQAGKHRRNQHGKQQCPEQRKRDRPGHGLKQAAFHMLQREDGQVGGDDNASREEDRALNLMRGSADEFGCCSPVAVCGEVPNDVLHHHHRAVPNHAQIRGDMPEIQADGCEEQRKGDGDRNDERSTKVPQEKEQDDHHQCDTFAEVLQHCACGEVD